MLWCRLSVLLLLLGGAYGRKCYDHSLMWGGGQWVISLELGHGNGWIVLLCGIFGSVRSAVGSMGPSWRALCEGRGAERTRLVTQLAARARGNNFITVESAQ